MATKASVRSEALPSPSEKVLAVEATHGMIPENSELTEAELAIVAKLNVTEKDYASAKEAAEAMSLEEVRKSMRNVRKVHKHDANFPHSVLMKIEEFLDNEDVFATPENYEELIWEIKIEAAIITNDSPYSEVRAHVDNKDDPSILCSTIRAWTMGILFSFFLAFTNQLFSIRLPMINIHAVVAQLIAYPIGVAWAKWIPDKRFTVFGKEFRLNPGPFTKKEHMLITIMANAAESLPYTQYIIWVQVLPQYFNQPYARSFGYQILIALSTNFIGYGLAGLTRSFLVYPSFCLWPGTFTTIAMNDALHNETNDAVVGPFKKVFTISRLRFFLWTFAAMFVYFWFPNYLFEAMSYFSWMTWIAPNHKTLNAVTGMRQGLGLFNPLPTLDWNVFADIAEPLMKPAFTNFNTAVGMFLSGLAIMGIYFTNTWNTGYLPINSNGVFDHFGEHYNVSSIVNEHGLYDHEKYTGYSAAYLSAANCINYGTMFGMYSAAVIYVALFHRHEVTMGFKALWKTMRRTKRTEGVVEEEQYADVHNRLMAAYPEVSQWWYFGLLVFAVACGLGGICGWPTLTTWAVIPFGVLLALVFVIPLGIIKAMTGVQIGLNVLAEFIGGMWAGGNALEMNFFKTYGYITCSHAISFANDMKLAHYLKIPPLQTFMAQVVATLISTFVACGVMQVQLNITNVCTADAPMRFICPGPNTFFTASVLWGTIGPSKVFGFNGQYNWLLLGFPIGAILPISFYLLRKKYPKTEWVRQIHPVVILGGAGLWAPYSFSYVWPSVPIAWFSWIYLKKRYLALWQKYNFVLSASLSAGVAISAIVMFFSVGMNNVEVKWWGNEIPYEGCEGKEGICTMLELAAGQRFFPWWDGVKVPAP